MTNPWIAQQRLVFKDEVEAHKTEIAAMLLSEGDPLQTCEALFNRVLLMRANGHPDYSIMQMLHSGFYGPINRQGLPRLVAIVRANPRELQIMFNAIDQAMAGSDTIHGFTDQGLKTDPNGWRTPRLDMGGNVYNDWAGDVRVNGVLAGINHTKAEAWRQWFETSALQFALKEFLNPQVLGGLEIDGVYGVATAAAVEEFQKENALLVDGIAGPQTWRAINKKFDRDVANFTTAVG